MRTQQDHRVRVVALDNLRAMCERQSAFSHRYWVEKVTRSRVWVAYSNPSEYGTERPVYAVYPAYPMAGEPDNPRVVLDILRVIGDDGTEGWQAFEALHECPVLYRSGPEADDWATADEHRARRREG